MKRTLLVGALLATSLSIVSAAFASGTSFDGDDLAAGGSAVGECDSPTGKWTTAFAPAGAATTTTVTVTNIATACNGMAVRLTVFGTGGTSLAQRTGTVGGCTASPNSCSVSFSDLSVSTTAVRGLAMVVTG